MYSRGMWRLRKFNYSGSFTFNTMVTIDDGEEVDDVEVEYEASPAEPDVGWQGGLDLIAVRDGEREILGRVADLAYLQFQAEADLNERVRAFYEDCPE